MNKVLCASLLGVVLLTILASPVSAATFPRTQERVDQRCQLITQRIDGMISRYETNRQQHIDTYQKMVERLQIADTRLKAEGYNTAQVESDYKVLADKVIIFAQDVQAVTNQLKVARQQQCGNSNGAFKVELLKAQKLSFKARTDAQDIQTYYQTVIRKDMLSLKKQTPK